MLHRRWFDGIYGPDQRDKLKTFWSYIGPITTASPGGKRRSLIKQMFESIPSLELYVNVEGSLHTKYDLDLRKLLRQGFLKSAKRRYGWGNATATVLLKNDCKKNLTERGQ